MAHLRTRCFPAAFAQRGGLFWLSMVGVYGAKGKATPEMKAKVDAWLLELVTAIKPHVVRVEGDKAVGTLGGGGGAINTFGQQGSAAKTRVARLLAAKTKYDPGNVFRFIENGMSNVTNIDPAAGIEVRVSVRSMSSCLFFARTSLDACVVLLIGHSTK